MAVLLQIIEFLGIFLTITSFIGLLWIIPRWLFKRKRLKDQFKELTADTLKINRIKDKYNNEFMLYIDEINFRIHFHLYPKRRQIQEMIKLYILYVNSPQFKNVYMKYSIRNNKFCNRKKILMLNRFLKPFLLKHKLKLVESDMNDISEYIVKTDKYLDMMYNAEDKFMATAGETYREFIIMLDIYNNNILVLHSHAGDGKTFISNFHAELLLNRKRPILFLDSLSINKKLEKFSELTKEFLDYKIFKAKAFLMDGLNEFILTQDEITAFFHLLTKFRKRDKLIITTRTVHYEKYFTHIPSVYDFSFKYYKFLNSFGKHDALRKNILIDLYCNYYEINRHDIGPIGDYIFTQMLLVKIYFKLLDDSFTLKVADKTDLFNKYISLMCKNCSEKLNITVTFEDINNIFSCIINERLKTTDILYSSVISSLGVREQKILDFLVNEEIVLRKEEDSSNGYSILLIFNFDDIRDYLIVNHLMFKYSSYADILTNYKNIISKIDNIVEGTYEHLLLSSKKSDQLALLNEKIDQADEDLKMRLLIKNGIFNDYISENISEDIIYKYSSEITEIIIKSFMQDKKFPGNKRFKDVILKDRFNRFDLLDSYRDEIGREKAINDILSNIKDNPDDYDKHDVLTLMKLLLDVKETYSKTIELREEIIVMYNFTRSGKK